MAIVFLIYEIIEIMSSEKEMIYDINNNNISTNNIIENEANITVNNVAKRMNKKVVNEYMGYKVVAELEIETINLDTYVLENSENALNKAPIHF